MFKILLPSDFSTQSENAINFTAKITEGMVDVELILFHSIYIHGITPGMLKEIEDILIKETSFELNKISQKINEISKGERKLKHKIVFGNPVSSILDYANENKVDLIVMSRHISGAFEKALIGSHTISVLKHSQSPVLIVPEKTGINKIIQIAYTTNLEHLVEELETIVPLAKIFNANIHIVHIYPEVINAAKFDVKQLTQDITTQLNYKNISFYFAMNNDIMEGIEDFINEFHPDLLVMYTKHRGLWEELFNKSITAGIAVKEEIPILAIPRKKNNN